MYDDDDYDRLDASVGNIARAYDYYLGGAHNFPADRELAQRAMEAMPAMQTVARANRAFVIRAIQRLAAEGYDQFLDIGCGLPTQGAVHEVAPHAAVVYVDNDLTAVHYSRSILAGIDRAAVVHADLRRPYSFLEDPVTARLLDFDRPVVVVLAAIFHFIPDSEHPDRIMATIRDALPRESVLVFSHGSAGPDVRQSQQVVKLYNAAHKPAVSRTREEVTALLAGYGIISPPGVTWVTEIYPEPGPRSADEGPRSHMYGAIARIE